MERGSPNPFNELISRAESLISRLEQLLPVKPESIDWSGAAAFRWVAFEKPARLVPVIHLHQITLANLLGIDDQKQRLQLNIRQLVQGLPANNALLTGARGTGKSSLVKAILNRYAPVGLRLIEINKTDLTDLPEIMSQICHRPEKFIIFCDDLSFESDETAYKALKVALDGSVSPTPDNVIIVATSNRRHLLPEFFAENLEGYRANDEIHPGEAVEQKISLSERFGLWISFHPFNQEQYLDIVRSWLGHFGMDKAPSETMREAALQWALLRGSRSGRTAWQFARDFAGRAAVRQDEL